MKKQFNITGMTCSSCSSHVEKAVIKLDGVKNVNVNLLSNSMIVEFNENIVDINIIIKAVEDAGYGASLSDNENKNSYKKDDEIKSIKNRFIISVIFLIPLIFVAMYKMVFNLLDIDVPLIIQNIFESPLVFAITQVILLIPIVYVNRNYFIIGFKRLFKGSPNMDCLVALGSTASIAYGIFSIIMISLGLKNSDSNLIESYVSNLYFDSAGMILTLITLGKYLEAKSKGKTSDAINKLINLTPNTAIVIRNEKEISIKIEEIVIGDVVVIKPGASIPVDGAITYGTSFVDESSITGESIPVEKNINDKVISGTINKNGYLRIRAEKVGSDTTLSQIIKLVEEASNSKAPISKLADKVSGIFVPIVIAIAILSFVLWILNGQSFEFALSTCISVLVISCPCALGLATPVAIMVGTGIGAKNGIIIKSAESLEVLHKVDTVVLDKTGTLTRGKPIVTDIISYIDEGELLKIAGTLENNSEHPLGKAILEKVNKENISIYNIDEFKSVSGRGISGKINRKIYFGGNLKFIQENNIYVTEEVILKVEPLLNEGKTPLYFASEKQIIGIIFVADTLKEESYQMIEELKKRNIDTYMVTGDNKIVANHIGYKLGIKNIVSEVLPKDKNDIVEKLQKENKGIAFVGDGINDTVALTAADIGIAIGTGTDIAIESADIVLMKDSLKDVITAIDLSKAVINNIKLNLFWAFIYNVIGIPIAAGVFYFSLGLKLNPMIGAAAMSFSSVCVVTNALRLNKFKSKFKEKKEIMENSKVVYIDGMSCNHCKMSVEKALYGIDGITNVEVNLEEKNATITFNKEIKSDIIKNVIDEAGFTVKEIK